jgi:uncharacterized protein (DUF2267 family)
MNAPNVFGEPIAQAHTWLHEINAELGGWMSDDYALQALRAGLHTLRDQLTVDQVAHLSAQLPMLVRGIYYEDWVPSKTPARERHEETFLNRVTPYFRGKQHIPDAKEVLRAVYHVLHHHISEGESKKVHHVLPADLKKYWPAQNVYGEIETPAAERQP